MLDKPSLRVLSALVSLDGPEFEVVKGWLQSSLQNLYTDSCRTSDDVHSRWKQGAAQVLEDFLKKSETARETLNKSR
jgi:hypothetical protein